jgi:hypothetical protein
MDDVLADLAPQLWLMGRTQSTMPSSFRMRARIWPLGQVATGPKSRLD